MPGTWLVCRHERVGLVQCLRKPVVNLTFGISSTKRKGCRPGVCFRERADNRGIVLNGTTSECLGNETGVVKSTVTEALSSLGRLIINLVWKYCPDCVPQYFGEQLLIYYLQVQGAYH